MQLLQKIIDPITIHNSSRIRCLPAQRNHLHTYHQRYHMWGFLLPHVVRPSFESPWTEQCPIVGKIHTIQEIPDCQKNPYIQNITHQEVPICTNLERPGDEHWPMSPLARIDS